MSDMRDAKQVAGHNQTQVAHLKVHSLGLRMKNIVHVQSGLFKEVLNDTGGGLGMRHDIG